MSETRKDEAEQIARTAALPDSGADPQKRILAEAYLALRATRPAAETGTR